MRYTHLDYRLVDGRGNVLAWRSSLRALRHFARISKIGRRAVAIEGPGGRLPLDDPGRSRGHEEGAYGSGD